MWCRLKFFLLYAFAEGNLPPICVKIGFCDRQILHIKMLAVGVEKCQNLKKKTCLRLLSILGRLSFIPIEDNQLNYY